MNIATPLGTYRWIEDWIKIPDPAATGNNGRTHGVAVTRDGRIVIFHQADPAVLIYSPAGELLNSWGEFPGAHGLTLVEEDGVELLWLADETTKEVVKATLDGEIVQSIPAPAHPAYATSKYIPTWAAVNEKRFGGNGDIWVADGYGCAASINGVRPSLSTASTPGAIFSRRSMAPRVPGDSTARMAWPAFIATASRNFTSRIAAITASRYTTPTVVSSAPSEKTTSPVRTAAISRTTASSWRS